MKKKNDDPLVRQCKRIALIQKGEFKKALDMMTAADDSNDEYAFQKAYCLYRLNKCQESHEIVSDLLKNHGNSSSASPFIHHLKAQIEYKMGQYDQSVHSYQAIQGNAKLELDHDEFLTNFSAAYTMDHKYDSALSTCKQGETYELAYNASCAAIGLKQYEKSISLLKEAETKCRKVAKSDGLNEQETDNELTAILVQTACVKQLTGDSDGALDIYREIMNKKPSDKVALVVAMNNSLSIHSERQDEESKKSLFDTEKKLKLATQEKVKDKLTTEQKKGLDLNIALLHLQMNKLADARSEITLLAEQMPNSEVPVILQAALLLKEKKPKEAIAVLERFLAENKGNNEHILLSLVQIRLDREEWSEAAKLLQDSPISNNPAIVRILTDLYQKTGDSKSRLNVLSNAIKYWQQEYEKSKDEETKAKLVSTCLASAKLQEEQRKHREAAQTYKTLADLDSKRRTEFYARMVNAMTFYDMEEAEKHLSQLPAVPTDLLNVDDLEANKTHPFGDYQKIKVASKPADQEAKKKSSKKKRKNKLPSDLSKSIDPNRWVSKKVKKQTQTRTTGFGTQGSSEGKEALQHEKGQKTIHRPEQVLGATKAAAAQKTKGKGKGKGKGRK